MFDIFSNHPYLIPLFIFVNWMLISLIISKISGWSRLAEHYRLRSTFSGEKWHMQSARIGWLSIRNALTFGVNAQGIFLGMFPLFRIGHPPLQIPIGDISANEKKSVLGNTVRLGFKRAPGVTLTITPYLAERIEEKTQGQWRYQRAE